MNKVITINLAGVAYQLEESGYDALRAYLETAATRLQGNPDRDEIISDVERAIGEKFRALTNSYRTVVFTKEVAAVLAEMGPIEDVPGDRGAASAANPGGGASATGAAGSAAAGDASRPPEAASPPKRLYRITEGAMLSGVCNGIAAYLNIDPTIVRLLFVLLMIFWGTGVLVYLVLVIVVPEAESPEQKAAAHGAPFTTQEFIRRAKAGYYEATKSFPDRHARKEWKRRLRQEMRGWGNSFRQETGAAAPPGRSDRVRSWSPGLPPGMGFALPVFSLLHGALVIVWLSTLVSILATGTLFGRPLPGAMPGWIAVVLTVFAYGFLAFPLKAMRWAVYRGDFDRSQGSWPFICFLDGLIRLAVVAVVVCLVIRYLPEAREAIRNIPPLFREAIDAIKEWWGAR